VRTWVATLCAQAPAYDDFLAWIDEREREALARFLNPTVDVAHVRGYVEALQDLRAKVRLNTLEEKQRARRNAA
jgi:hypothetical protein